MSYDDHYFPDEEEDARQLELSEEEDWYNFLRSTDPRDFDTTQIIRTIQDNAAWLQACPRGITEILSTLFPGSVRRSKDLPAMAAFIGGYLFDAGYTPQYDNPDYPAWHWLEGKPLPISENPLQKHPTEKVTPPLFISPEGAGSLHGTKGGGGTHRAASEVA